MWERFKAWVTNYIVTRERRSREQCIVNKCGCICFCPKCKEPLNDQADCIDTEFVHYHCTICGHYSVWNFGIAPVPILVERTNTFVDTQE